MSVLRFENYKEIKVCLGETIESVVQKLLSEYKKRGILAYTIFNGVHLFSDIVTMDEAYKSITGKTKSEFDEMVQKRIQETNKRKEEIQKNLLPLFDMWVEKGKEVLTEDRWEYWSRIVPVRLLDLYEGMELGCCLDVVKILNNGGTFDEAKEKFEGQGHSGTSHNLVLSMINKFCDRGQEFLEHVE